MSENEAIVQLGFSEPIEDAEQNLLVAHNSSNWQDWDGGKIGGKPSWLNPKELPTKPLLCNACKDRDITTHLRFICQIYSPADDDTGNADAFHRSLYVFACPNPTCSSSSSDSVVVLRGQLAKENEYYPPEETEDWKKHLPSEWNVNTCAICGQRATGKCPVSNQHFCGKEHQRQYHACLKQKKDLISIIYKESELVVEDEPMEDQSGDLTVEEANESSIFADSDDKDVDNEKDDADLEQSDLNEITGMEEGTSDPATLEFYTRIGRANGDVKSQCLRYSRWNDDDTNEEKESGPLWISSENKPNGEDSIPSCQYCGGCRKFEFQIMPQMVSFLRNKNEDTVQSCMTEEGKRALLAASDIVDRAKEGGNENELPEGFKERQEELVEQFKASLLQDTNENEALDFGTIVVYTCTNSCGGVSSNEDFGAYKQEFAWRQKPLM